MCELQIVVKMRSDNMELSTETTTLMREAMANLIFFGKIALIKK